MYENEYFVIDMTSCVSTGEIINNLSLALETLNNAGKRVVLKLSDKYLNQSQMLSIQSLITSYGCILDTIETTNVQTAQIAKNMNVTVQEPLIKRAEEQKPINPIYKQEDDSIAVKDINGLRFEADLDALQEKQENINISSDLQMAGINPRGDINSIENQIQNQYAQKINANINPSPISDNYSILHDVEGMEPLHNFSYPEIRSELEQKASQAVAEPIQVQKEEEKPYENFYSQVVQETLQETPREDIYKGIENKVLPQEQAAPVFQKEEIKYPEFPEAEIQNIQENTIQPEQIDNAFINIPEQPKEEIIENAEKNSIGVYKQANIEPTIEQEEWENVDFYETATNDPIVSDTKHTTYINQTLRSGQILEADGNVVIIGDCHPGSEIRAIGDITVWGVLSGIAHAGYKGNINSKVRALKLNAVQLRIGNCYSRRPDGTNIPYIIRSSVFTPEEARVVDNEIVLYKINEN